MKKKMKEKLHTHFSLFLILYAGNTYLFEENKNRLIPPPAPSSGTCNKNSCNREL